MPKLENHRYRETLRVTLIGAALDLLLGVLKIIFGLVGQSQGLIADGVHSLSDLGTDFLVILAAKYGTEDADQAHPYGHERIQTVTTAILGATLVLVALGIAYAAIMRVITEQVQTAPTAVTLVIAVVSVISKEWIFRYTLKAAKRLKSNVMEANAWHSRSDMFSSLVVIVGILGAQAGYVYLDALAAVAVAVLIVWVGAKMCIDSVREVIDTGLGEQEIQDLESAMLSVEGVRGAHQLRTRRMGSNILADAHVMVDPRISVSEGHRIGDEVLLAARRSDDGIDITVHIDPEDDIEGPASTAPLRSEITSLVESAWADICPIPIKSIGLHYLENKVAVELRLDNATVSNYDDLEGLAEQIGTSLAGDSRIGEIKVLLEFKGCV